MKLCFKKLLKFEICLKMRILKKISKKELNQIRKNLMKFIKVCKSL